MTNLSDPGTPVSAGLREACAHLPRRVRARLWWQHKIDRAAYWLVCHGHLKAAKRLWRVTGGW